MAFLFKQGSRLNGVTLFVFFTLFFCDSIDGYDPLDSKGNVTIQWDVTSEDANQYHAEVTIFNYQQYRHIDWPPGWSVSWAWQQHELIWNVQGAEAKEQGICNTTINPPPHCCLQRPVIIDLQPGAPYNKQTTNCCKGGVLTSLAQDPSMSIAHFQIDVGVYSGDTFNKTMPVNFSFGPRGYTCGPPHKIHPPTKFPEDGGRRWRQALRSFKVTCTYSQFVASRAPTCCVSLTAFYSETITKCQNCSCGCQGQPGSSCVKKGETPPVLLPPKDPDYAPPPLVNCTHHMCPIHVHWHIMQSYTEYWRVKITILNLNLRKNYTSWNLLVQHPNMNSLVEVYSFKYMNLGQLDRPSNDSALFWGIPYFNEMLLQSGENGVVQTEMILRKEPGKFSFVDGWAFPRKIYFNGENCVMPNPSDFPRLPEKQWHFM